MPGGLGGVAVEHELSVEGGHDLDECIERKVIGLGLLQLGDEWPAHPQPSRQGLLGHSLALSQGNDRIPDPQLFEFLLIATTELLILEQAVHNLPVADGPRSLHLDHSFTVISPHS